MPGREKLCEMLDGETVEKGGKEQEKPLIWDVNLAGFPSKISKE